jgi:hypothetical protein
VADVGGAWIVFVTASVAVGVEVGGKGVAVGMAASVNATMVEAEEKAVA